MRKFSLYYVFIIITILKVSTSFQLTTLKRDLSISLYSHNNEQHYGKIKSYGIDYFVIFDTGSSYFWIKSNTTILSENAELDTRNYISNNSDNIKEVLLVTYNTGFSACIKNEIDFSFNNQFNINRVEAYKSIIIDKKIFENVICS